MNIFDLNKDTSGSDLNGDAGDEDMGNSQPTENDMVVDALRQIIDPELGINVIDLGLVYEVRVNEKEVYVQMTMTTPGCPMHGSIVEAAERALKMHFPLKEVNVHLVWEPQWTPDRLSESARKQLGFR